jgi:DNA polymerase III alpha subunit (gram-positive type)
MKIVCATLAILLFCYGDVFPQNQKQRLSIEQQQLADQLRRLNSMLVALEASEREQGNIELADTLAGVHSYMNDAEGVGDLVLALQKVSQQLSQQHTASALESQVQLIEQLQLLLDMLLNSQADMQAEKQKQLLEERSESLKEMIESQQQLLSELQELSLDEAGAALTDEQQQRLEELQSEQQQLAEETKEFNKQQQQQGIKSEKSESAQEKQEQAAEELSQQDTEQAQEQQQQALDDLKQAQQEVEQQQQQDAAKEKQEALLNVEKEIERILTIHQAQHQQLLDIAAKLSDDGIPRSSMVQLRKMSAKQQEISLQADDLLLEIAQAGADSFPFYILSLMEDHQKLGENLQRPSIDEFAGYVELSEYLLASWLELLDVIATERERQRQQLESAQPQGEPQEEEQPLVQFATELQLLKRMQISLAKRIKFLENDSAGDDFLKLIERQGELQLQYESMIRRLQGANDKTESEEI